MLINCSNQSGRVAKLQSMMMQLNLMDFVIGVVVVVVVE